MTIEERKARILAKIQEMQADGKDMADALALLGYSDVEVLSHE